MASDKTKTKCIEPDAIVYGTMGSYGVHQRQHEFIHSAKMSVIRACAQGYITPDYAAERIISLQTSKPISVEEGERMARSFSDGLAAIGRAQNEIWAKQQPEKP